MTVKSKLFHNGIAVFLQKIVLAGRQIIVVPFFLAAWGVAHYGEWLTLAAVPAALQFSQLGIGNSIGNAFVLFYAKKDFTRASQTLRIGIWMITWTVVSGLIITSAVIAASFYGGILANLTVTPSTAVSVVILLMFSGLVNFFGPLNLAMFRARRAAHQIIHFQTSFEFLRITLTIIFLMAGFGMVWVAAVDCFCNTSRVIWLYIAGSRKIPEISPGNVTIDRQDIGLHFKKGLAYMLTVVSHALTNQGSLFITRVALGPEGVALLGTLRTVVNSLSQLYGGINATILPELQYALGSADNRTARKIFQTGMALTLLTAVTGAIFLFLFGPYIYGIWTGGKLIPPDYSWSILILTLFISAFWRTGIAVFQALNKPERLGIVSLVGSIVCVALSGLFVNFIGMNGVLLGLLSKEILLSFFLLPASALLLNQSLFQLPKDMYLLRHQVFKLFNKSKSL